MLPRKSRRTFEPPRMKSRTSINAAPRHGSQPPRWHPREFSISVQQPASVRSVLGTANTTTRRRWYWQEKIRPHAGVGEPSASKNHVQVLRARRAADDLQRIRGSSARQRPRSHGTNLCSARRPSGARVWRRASAPAGPNHSVKGTANGAPPGPGHRYAVHFLWPGPGVTPSSAPYLKR